MPKIRANGLDGCTGGYLLPALPSSVIASVAQGRPIDPETLEALRARHERDGRGATYGVKEGVDPLELAEAGWGVVFAHDADPAVAEALRPLLGHRRGQAGDRYREFTGLEGVRLRETARKFLDRLGRDLTGAADPDIVPYYLLLVGDPERIPFRFQQDLDVQYAVGRLHFATLEAYADYAEAVVAAEVQGNPRSRRAVFFGVRNPDDAATRSSADQLVGPLADRMTGKREGWSIEPRLRDDAKKADLRRLLDGTQVPALLFTASHGVGFAPGHPRHADDQGALVCQDWPGPYAWGPRAIPPEHLFAAADLEAMPGAGLRGMIAFLFACFGAGTPQFDEFGRGKEGPPRAIAERPFLSRLPAAMLTRGALAVVGHVDRAWNVSYLGTRSGIQLTDFESTLARVLDGAPIGFAMEFFNMRHAALSVQLNSARESIRDFDDAPDEDELARLWTANNDARNYVVLGDPAARLRFTSAPEG